MKLLHNILRGSTLATALFVFQSCYGMPMSEREMMMYDATIKVTDAQGKALPGVKVSARNAHMADFSETAATSDAQGLLQLQIAFPASEPYVDIRFEADGYALKDTTIEDVTSPEPDFTVKLEKVQ